jgi:deoxyribonuclease-4
MLLGAHMSISGGLFNAPVHGKNATCDVIQIFTKSSNQWKAKHLTDDEIDQFFSEQKNTGVKVVCAHDSYLINLASPDETIYRKSFDSFKIELERCHLLNVPFLVMHPGSHVGSGESNGLKKIAVSFNKLFEELHDNKTVVCLETTAGQGTNLGYSFEQLAQIIDMVDDSSRIGICLDSCHIFAAGYPIVEEIDYKATMKKFNQILGLKKLKVIHLNDSKKAFGSRVDRHEHIGKGEMGPEPFRHIMNDRRLNKVPKILETPKGDDYKEDIENLKVLRSFIVKNEKAPSEKI